MKKLVSFVLAIVIVISSLSVGVFSAYAGDLTQYSGSERLASSITLDPDGDYIPEEGDERPNTTEIWDAQLQQFVVNDNNYAESGFGTKASDGRVWANKILTTDEATGNVQIQLSALGQQYSSTVSSYTPGASNAVDAVLILDVTGSMLYGMSADSTSRPAAMSDTRAYNMIEAVNAMVAEVMTANPMNRVSIVVFHTDNNYNNNSKVLVPLGSYTQFADGTKKILTMSAYSSRNQSGTIRENVKNTTVSITGGTDGQDGVALGSYQLWNAVKNKTNNEIDAYGNTVRRSPFVLYLTDGACNAATTRWYDNNTGSNGNLTTTGRFHEASVNNPTNLELAQISALTILTSAIQKDRITDAYKAYNKDDTISTIWFNIGLAVTDDNSTTNYAKATLSPRWCNETQVNNTTNNNRVVTQIKNYASSATNAGSSANTKYATFPTYQYTKNIFSNDTDKEFIYYADSAEKLNEAFSDLGATISSISKETTLPVSQKQTVLGGSSAVHFEDTLGEGVEIVGNLEIDYENDTFVLEDNGNGLFVCSENPELKVEFDKAARKLVWDIPGKFFPQWTFKNGINGDGGYNEAKAIVLKINVAPSKEAINNGQTKFYSNAYENGVPQATVTYYPKDDNPFYFKTNEHAGVVSNQAVLGINQNNVNDYFIGEEVGTITKGTVLHDVYFSGEMYLNDTDNQLRDDNAIGTIIPTLDTTGMSDDLFAAVQNSIKDCRIAAAGDLANANNTFAFRLGIPDYRIIRELKNANPTNTYPYIYSDSISDDGTFTFKAYLGNNALMEPICSIAKEAPTDVKSTSWNNYRATIEYTVTVHNFSNEEITNVKVKDSQTGLTLTNNANNKVTYSATNNTFTISSIAANSDCTFKYTKAATTQTVTNTATIESVNGQSLLFGASDSSKTTIVAYNTTTYTVNFVDADGTTIKTDTVTRNGAANAPEMNSKPGMIFIGWDKEFNNITANTTVTAKYEMIDYTESYSFKGEAPKDITAPENSTIHYGDTVTAESELFPAGKTISGTKNDVNGNWIFGGWSAVAGVDDNGKATGDVKFEGTWTFNPITNITINVNDVKTDLGTVKLEKVDDASASVDLVKNAVGDYTVKSAENEKFYVYIDGKKVLDKDGQPFVVTAGTDAQINYYSVDFYKRDGGEYSNQKYDFDGEHKDLVIEGTVISNLTGDTNWFTSQDQHSFDTKFDFNTPITSKTELFNDKAFAFNYYTTFNFNEPWEIKCYCTLKYNGKYIDSPNESKVTDYAIYFYRGDFDEAQPTLNELKTSDKTTVIAMGDEAVRFNQTTNVGQKFNRIGAGYKDIYIYKMKNPVYVAFEFEYDGVTYTSTIKDRSLYNVNETYIAEANNGFHTTYTDTQLEFLTAMKDMYAAVSAVCTSDTDVPAYPHHTAFAGESYENANLFNFHTSAAIRNIEPWGYKIESQVVKSEDIMPLDLEDENESESIDLSMFDDFGILVYKQKGDVVPSLQTILKSQSTANYSYKDENVFYDGDVITAYHFDGIRTADLNTNIYVVSYTVIDGVYSYSEPTPFNYTEIAEHDDSQWADVSNAIINFENAYANYEAAL